LALFNPLFYVQNEIGVSGAFELGAWLDHMHSLRTLDVRFNGIGRRGPHTHTRTHTHIHTHTHTLTHTHTHTHTHTLTHTPI
jgi:hypothetical protein